MCGIGGILNFNKKPVEKQEIGTMMNTMSHRGPDAEGFFLDHELALGHRRLSIIDLSDAANQPFADVSGRYVIVFNGEIYNYKEVKPLLNDYPFRTHGDTEVVLAGYIRWGTDCLNYLRGMFTIVIWDKERRELFVARDRLGVKPFYYYKDDHRFLFASEIRAILAVADIERKLDRVAIAEYLRYQSVGFPFSPIEGIKQLEAGSWQKISDDGKIVSVKYWNPTDKNYDFEYTEKAQVENKVRELMLQSVKRRLVSDVPVAAFLSGGIDSSAVVGLMVEAGDASPNTFNVSFDESAFDESKYADIIARKFNTKHVSVRLKPEVMLDELTNALDAMDTPSGDGINTYVVSKAIHDTGIRVALSGVGGDELFAGYPIFLNYIDLQNKRWIWGLPRAVRNAGGQLLGKGEKKDRIRQLMKMASPDIENSYPIFRQITSPANLKKFTNLHDDNPYTLSNQLSSQKNALGKLPFYSQVTAAEYIGYTQQTLLKDTDQMSMAHSLEVREPFFDQDLVEFVMSVPDHLKVPVYPKSLLVESLKPMLPNEIVHRKKQGFVFPWNDWMKNELRSFCDEHIQRMAERDFIRGDRLKYAWNLFLSGDRNVRWLEIWLFVVLNYWMEKNRVN
jgi:asparagine synthase (glutamine-hydrolysing)